MNVPAIYSKILEGNKLLKGIVYSTLETFSDLYCESKLYFFEEYTDHGIRHIEAVLRSSVDIISEETMDEFMDEENVAALLLSVLLHDLGMHQSPKTFRHLIQQRDIKFPDFDSLSWSDLWENFTAEAKRFNSQQKRDVYGNYDYVISIPTLEDIDELNGYQRKLIGEFIRRHHARLAHEIAVYGFETGTEVIAFADKYDREKLDLVGLIARSHGINIRDTYGYLHKRYSRVTKQPYGIHVYYLMVVLRLSDYFQIDIDRLLLNSLKLKTFKSPVSEAEHNKHFSIKEIREVDDDPETLFVRALPETNFIYWRLTELINDIQLELDISWAVLGEKYGKDKIKPRLKYRRVVSNLDDDSYKERISFVPEKILFDAHPDLAKLLVGPLYGNNPTYGVRELIQNALDAIQERVVLQKLCDESEGLIEIEIRHDSKEEYYFEIRDNGKGMNVKEIKEYFLKAGSTNRKSKEWDDLYLDNERNYKVLKSGKFGVGVLAAFLIGNELEVRTRRFDSNSGLCFKANINSRNIEVTKINNCPIGTSIRIKLTSEALEYFKGPIEHIVSWDKWYTLKRPKINYKCILKYAQDKFGYEEYDPSYSEHSNEWIEFTSKGFNKLRWSYDEKRIPYRSSYQLTYNGLIVPSPPPLYSGSIPPPHVQVFDFNGIFPINLSRNTLDSNKLPFERELVNSVFKEVLRKILEIEPEIIIEPNLISLLKKSTHENKFGKIDLDDFYNGFLYSLEGYCIKGGYINELARRTKVLVINVNKNTDINTLSLRLNDRFFIELSRFDKAMVRGYLTQLTSQKSIEWAIYSASEENLLIFDNDKDYIKEEVEVHSRSFVMYKRKDIKSLPIYFKGLTEKEVSSVESLVCYSRKNYSFDVKNREFGNFLAGIFSGEDNFFIPYNLRERRKWIERILLIAESQMDK